MEKKVSIAIIDDDAALASNLKDILEAEGYSVEAVYDGRAGIALFQEKMFDLGLVDVKLPDIPGPELVSRLSRVRPETEYVMITAHATIETAIEAIRHKQVIGYENKPVDMDHLLTFIRQVIRRRWAEEEQRISEANYRTIFDTANDAIFVHDFADGRVIDVNRKMCEMYGYTVEEARHIDVEVLSEGVSPYSQKEAMEWIQKAAEGTPQLFEWKARDKHGKPFWVEVNLKRSTIANEDRLLAIVRNIDERKRAEEGRITRLQTLTHLNQIISSSLEIDKVLGEIAKATARLMDAQIVTIWAADETTQILELKAFSDEKMHEDFRIREMPFNQGGAGLVATQRRPINIPDVFVDKRHMNLDWWQKHSLKSFFGYPIFLDQTLIAVLGLGGREPFIFEPEDQALLENLVAQAAIAIKNARLFEEIRRLSISDGLTGVANRRHFDKQFNREWQRNRRNNLPIGVVMIDIDFFKNYNDTYGHQAGDECLKQVAKMLQKSLRRPADLLARYGGEEFVALLPEINIEGTSKIAYSMRQAIMELNIPHRGSKVHKNLTISLGVAGGQPNEFQRPEDLLAKADQALYKAKNDGRNKIALA